MQYFESIQWKHIYKFSSVWFKNFKADSYGRIKQKMNETNGFFFVACDFVDSFGFFTCHTMTLHVSQQFE